MTESTSMDCIVTPAANLFRQKASSFSKAAAWLPEQSRTQVTELYNFLRTVDDLVDDSENPTDAAQRLDSVCAKVTFKSSAKHVEIPGVSFALDKPAVLDFLAGQKSDLAWRPILTESELVQYCYQVAGTVGVMLCPVLGAQGEVARQAALRLGIAMQMTNIARDILEDAQRGRLYLPANWFPCPIDPSTITQPEFAEPTKTALLRLLKLAETYYQSAKPGFHQLPVRERFVVILAARLYRQIGRKIMADPDRALRGRTRLSQLDRWQQFSLAAIQWLGTLIPFSRSAASDKTFPSTTDPEP